MGIFYEVQGSMKVKDTRKTRKLLAELNDNLGEIDSEVVDNDDKTFTVNINGGMFCSYSTAEEVDTFIKAFGPHVVEVGYFDTCCENNEHSDLWVGKPDEVEKAIRASKVETARQAIKALTEEEWEALHDEVTDAHFWIG